MDESQQKLTDALATLEKCLETPFVPGELERWFHAVETGVAEVRGHLRPVFERTHRAVLEEIFQEDPGLEHRIEQLRREDAEALEQFERFSDKSRRLAAVARRVEPDEARIKDECYTLVEEGLAFVISARKQEVALRTWLIEALERDRGVVD
jgi:hypothetical protein